jgi:hypothetical protein
LLLVAGLSDLLSSSTAPVVQTATPKNGETREKTPAPATDAADDELLVSVDRALEESLLAGFIVEEAS